MTTTTAYREQLLSEVHALPNEYLPYLLQIVQMFRDSVTLKPVTASLKQGWREAHTKDIAPVHISHAYGI